MKAARVLRTVLLVVVLILAIAILGANYYLGPVVKAGIEKLGPEFTQVSITLEQAHFRLLRGAVGLKNLVVGNPEGYNTPFLFKLGEMKVKVDVASLTKDTIVIEQIYIGNPEINYEKSLRTSNIGQLLENVEGKKPAEAKPEEKEKDEPASGEGGKKVIIKDFLLENAKMTMTVSMAGGHAVPVPLPPIHLTNIGEEEGGASPKAVLARIFGAILGGITKSAGAVVGVAGDAAVEGTKAIEGAAEEGVKAVGSAVTEGTGKLFGGMKGLIPGQKKPETPADAPVIQPTAPEAPAGQ